MDPRLSSLGSIRKAKMDGARRDFIQAYQIFAQAFRRCEQAMQRRDRFAEQARETVRQDMAGATSGAVSMAEIQAIHAADERRNGMIALLETEVQTLTAERERLRAIALAKQSAYLQARKAVEKLRIMVDKLREEEISLQTRLSESFADSVSRDAVTGAWKLRQMD